MADLNEVICFVRVAEQRSITKAAKILDLPKSTVSRRISALEQRLKVTLLRRTTRTLNLTEAGERYFEQMLPALLQIEKAEEDLHQTRGQIEGHLKVTAPIEFGTGVFMQVLKSFQDFHPHVTIELLLTERVVDLVAEGIDLAVRIGALQDSTLISRRLGTVTGHLVASVDYISKHGAPKNPDDLHEHSFIAFTPGAQNQTLLLRAEGGRRSQIKIQPKLRTNNIIAVKSAILNGHGIGTLPLFMLRDELQAKDLKVVMPHWTAFAIPISLVYPGQRFVAPKTRALMEYLSQQTNFLE
jgi:DNA-binding transcriptional LysR family regulator